MITFSSGGRLGNRLFQYVLPRLLAERLEFHLGTSYHYNDTLTATRYKQGARYDNNRTVIIESVEMDNILEMVFENRHYHLQGFWQESKYYLSNRDKILGYFNEKSKLSYKNKDDIIMHIRIDDYKQFGPGGTVLDPQYYIDCIENEDFDNLYIVTDSPGDPYLRNFYKYKPLFPMGTEKEDFWLMASFSKIITGNSSFSWWAAFLSQAHTIYVPECWIRNSYDINHSLQYISNGITEGIPVPAGFIDY